LADPNLNFDIAIVTPDGVREEFNVSHLRAPGSEGDFGVLANHLPFLTSLRIGEIELDTGEGKKIWATSGGFAEVLNDRVTILAETAEPAEQIDIERAEASKLRATERLKEQQLDIDYERNRLSLYRAINRLKVASSK